MSILILILVVICLIPFLITPVFAQESIELGGTPGEIVINEKTNKIYVSLYISPSNNKIAVIDGNSNKLEATINAGFQIAQMDINPNTNKIYLLHNRDPPALYELDGATNIIQEIPNTDLLKESTKHLLRITSSADYLPSGITTNSQKNLIIFSASYDSDTWVGFMDGRTFELKAILKGTEIPTDIAVNDKTNQVYIISFYRGSMGVVDGNSQLTGKEIPPKSTIKILPGHHLAINENTNTIYVSHGSSNRISIIDGKTNQVSGDIDVRGGAYELDIDENTNRLYVLSEQSKSVKIIDANSKQVLDEFSLPSEPRGMGFNSVTKTLYVGNEDGMLYVINTDDSTPPKLTVPSPIAVETRNPDGKPVSFKVTATDDTDSNVRINCNPPSGSVFEPGTTTVSCATTDSSGRSSVERFTVTVNLDKAQVPITSGQPQSSPITSGQPQSSTSTKSSGGCLIATATFGSELAPQVQLLRETRDNTILNTASGASFMTAFNHVYYSFSPAIADLERENPAFREAVKLTITPMLSTLTIMTLADEGSESQVMGLGISVIALNLGIYIAAPTAVAFAIKKHLKE